MNQLAPQQMTQAGAPGTTGEAPALTGDLRSTLFLVWGPPAHGPRSRVFARKLGIGQPHFIYSTTRRGMLAAPLKYSYQTIATLRLLWRLRPRLIFVQSPPNLAVLIVYIYCIFSGARYIVDAHSDAFTSPFWSRPRWLNRFLARRAVTTIVTNEHFQEQITRGGGHAFVLRDIPTTFPDQTGFPVQGGFNVVVVNTFADDEPLSEILQAAERLDDAALDSTEQTTTVQATPHIHFYITGKTSRAPQPISARLSQPGALPAHVHFTDFLPDADYYALLNSADAVMCLTTRNHTMQRGACEALSLGKPIITSDWPLLKDYFHRGAVHVDNSAAGIHAGVRQMAAHHDHFQTEIKELQKDQLREWRQKIGLLNSLIDNALNSNQTKKGREENNGAN